MAGKEEKKKKQKGQVWIEREVTGCCCWERKKARIGDVGQHPPSSFFFSPFFLLSSLSPTSLFLLTARAIFLLFLWFCECVSSPCFVCPFIVWRGSSNTQKERES
jgi:hypothetical protein